MKLIPLTAAALALAAAPALGHNVAIDATCTGATFTYSVFPASGGTVTWRALVDGVEHQTGSATITGRSGVIAVTFDRPIVGEVTLRLESRWVSDRIDRPVRSMTLACPVPPPPVAPPPPPVVPPVSPEPPAAVIPPPPPVAPPVTPPAPRTDCPTLIRNGAGRAWLVRFGCVTPPRVVGPKCPPRWTSRVSVIRRPGKPTVRVRLCVPPPRYSPPVTG